LIHRLGGDDLACQWHELVYFQKARSTVGPNVRNVTASDVRTTDGIEEAGRVSEEIERPAAFDPWVR
jgi:hypothetical protein